LREKTIPRKREPVATPGHRKKKGPTDGQERKERRSQKSAQGRIAEQDDMQKKPQTKCRIKKKRRKWSGKGKKTRGTEQTEGGKENRRKSRELT